MSSLQEMRGSLRSGAERLALALQVGIDSLGDALADIPETLGNALENSLAALGRALKSLPGAEKVLAWLGETLAGLTNLGGALVKAGFGLISGLAGGLVRLLGGALALDRRLLLKGLIDLGSNPAGALIVFAGKLVSIAQRVFGLQGRERGLNEEEKELLRKVFHGSLALYNIRLIQGRAGVFGGNQRAFTLANTIYMKNTDPAREPEILVHECVHVWQYQHAGSRYTMDALGAQALYKDAYDWRAEVLKGKGDWLDFNKEAQAKLIQDVWFEGALAVDGQETKGSGRFFDLEEAQARGPNREARFNDPAETALALAAVRALRARRNLRLSKNL